MAHVLELIRNQHRCPPQYMGYGAANQQQTARAYRNLVCVVEMATVVYEICTRGSGYVILLFRETGCYPCGNFHSVGVISAATHITDLCLLRPNTTDIRRARTAFNHPRSCSQPSPWLGWRRRVVETLAPSICRP